MVPPEPKKKKKEKKKRNTQRWGTSPVVQWLTIHLPMQGTRVRSLVGERKSHMTQVNEVLLLQQRPSAAKIEKKNVFNIGLVLTLWALKGSIAVS